MRRVSKRVAATMATSSSSQNTPAPTTNSTMNTRNDPNLPFDLSTVKTIPDENIVRTKGKRIFGIQEAPTFYPTKEEFQDPLKYIEKISPQGEQYGIIKIVPPKDYKPEFSLKTEVLY
jgi:histone demethylase JARID1